MTDALNPVVRGSFFLLASLLAGGQTSMRLHKTKTLPQRVVSRSGVLVLACGLSLSAQQMPDPQQPPRSSTPAPAWSDRHEGSEIIYDSAIGEWGSVFADMRPNPRVKELLAANQPLGKVSDSCSDSSSGSARAVRIPVLQHLLSWFQVPTVHAQGCGRSACRGHYMSSRLRPCLGDCTDYFPFYFSAAQRAMYWQGYRDSGGAACCGRDCAESGCMNWY